MRSSEIRTRLRVCLIAALTVLGATGVIVSQARAQVAILVNGDPITSYDIEQRTRFLQVTSRKVPSRQEVVDQLIEEKLKLGVAKRYQVESTTDEVESAFANMAQRMRLSSEQFSQQLSSAGINVKNFKTKLKADMGWQTIIRGKYAGEFQFREQDILAEVKKSGEEKGEVGYEFILRPILFFVPRGAPQSEIEARKREAEALRGRFQGCDTGLPFARALRNVAVRDQVIRNSADLSPQLRQQLAGIEIGKLTPPEMTQSGVEMFAVCNRRESNTDTPSMRAAREALMSQKFQSQATRYLQQLRRQAMIEYKQ